VKSRGESDPGITLLELFSYVGDACLTTRIRSQTSPISTFNMARERASLCITLGEGLRPAACVIADGHGVYVLTVGSEAESARHVRRGHAGEASPYGRRGTSPPYIGGCMRTLVRSCSMVSP
jgi:hypothetical protein